MNAAIELLTEAIACRTSRVPILVESARKLRAEADSCDEEAAELRGELADLEAALANETKREGPGVFP